MLEYDRVEVWGPGLTDALSALIPAETMRRLADLQPVYIEDAHEALRGPLGVDRMTLSAAAEDWLNGQEIAAYHGSRLTLEEMASVRTRGFRPLSAAGRCERLRTVLSSHPEWAAKGVGLAQALIDHGPGERAGRREGQVHLTLSRSALLDSFNHYLTHGSEFDQRVAWHLLGKGGLDLLGMYGLPVVFTVSVPGAVAIKAANRWGRHANEEPNLVREVVTLWAAWMARPEWTGKRYLPDCGIMFERSVDTAWIVSAENVDVSDDS